MISQVTTKILESLDASHLSFALAEAQTQVGFALVLEGEVTEDASGALSVSYQGGDSSADSNSFTPAHWANDGTLNGSLAEPDFADVIYAGSGSRDGDAIDGGAGKDDIIASWGDDRVQGGEGDDRIDGLAGDDVLDGGDGDDNISADGIAKVGNLNSVASSSHGADFVDGGAGKDNINGDGKDDQLFGSAGNNYEPFTMNLIAACARPTRARVRFGNKFKRQSQSTLKIYSAFRSYGYCAISYKNHSGLSNSH